MTNSKTSLVTLAFVLCLCIFSVNAAQSRNVSGTCTRLVRAHSFACAAPPKEYAKVLKSLKAKLDNYTKFVNELDTRIKQHKEQPLFTKMIHPLPDHDADEPASLYDEKLVNLCKAMKVGLTTVIDDVEGKYHSRYCEEISRIKSSAEENKNHHIETLEKFYAKSLETLHKETAGLPKLSLEIVDEKLVPFDIEKCIDIGLNELKEGLLDKLEHLCDQFYEVLQSEKEMNFADHMNTLQKWSEEIKKGNLKQTKSKQTEHLSGIMDMLRKYQTEETHNTIKNYRGKELVVQQDYQDEDFRLSKGEEVTVDHVETGRIHSSEFNLFKSRIVQVSKRSGSGSCYVPASIFAPWEQSTLWQICQQICDLVLKDDATVAGSGYAIRPVPKNGARMFTKGVRKYDMKFSKVTDSFGCTIITADFNHHIKVLRKVFDSFKGDGQLFTVNNNLWRIQLQKVKLNLSNVAADARDFEIRHAYVDDKVIFHATRLKKNGEIPSPKNREILRLESIILPKKIMDLKEESHKVYDQVRELGSLIGGQLNRFCNEYVMDKMYTDLKSYLANKRFPSGLKGTEIDDFETQLEQCEIEYQRAKQHGIGQPSNSKHKYSNSAGGPMVHEVNHLHKHFRVQSVRSSVEDLTSEEYLRHLGSRSKNPVPAIQKLAMFNANKDDIARSKYVNSMFYLCRQMYKKINRLGSIQEKQEPTRME